MLNRYAITYNLSNTYPYAMITAPSSLACSTVLYPLEPWGPLRKTANFSGKFLCDMKGSNEIGGSNTSDTNELTTPVNEEAILRT